MKFISPLSITDTMIASGTTVPEPAATETAWTSGGTYAIGDKRILASTHRVYLCIQASTGRTQTPDVDVEYWRDDGPTQRWAPFDIYTSTPATGTTSVTYVLRPGYVNALALYGLVGTHLTVTLKDAPGGTVIYSYDGSLFEYQPSWYEYLFVAPRAITQFSATNLPIRPDVELTISVSAASGQPVAIGMITLGDLIDLVGIDGDGGTEYGASAEPVSYSYIKTDDFGTTTIVRRHKATGLTASVALPQQAADEALRQIQQVLDVPAAWIATSSPGYQGLNVFGLATARLVYETAATAKLQLTVKGLI